MSRFSDNLTDKILKAISNNIRREIIKRLYISKESSFTELMYELNMSPEKDSGKFGHHLKSMIKSGLVREVKDKGGYELTDVGREVALLIQELDEKIKKRDKKLLVRTSNLTMESFEKKKIIESLMREANVPRKLAEEIAIEAEEKINQSKITYLTAPLIREIVNSILLERGLEDYRHNMTRLGLPVYDVEKIVNDRFHSIIYPMALYIKAGSRVISEYMLIKELPREISDAHISGAINLNNLPYFGVIPETIHHSFSQILEKGISFNDIEGIFFPNIGKIGELSDALFSIIKFTNIFREYISVGQVIDDINVILAPFTRNLSYEEVKEAIRKFLIYLNYTPDFTGKPQPLAISLRLDKSLEKNSFFEEKMMMFKAFMEVLYEGEENNRPFLSPVPIVKLDLHAIESATYYDAMYELSKLVSRWAIPIIINLEWYNNHKASYCWDLSRIEYEIDKYSIGRSGTVLINLPRIALDSKNDDSKFFSRLDEVIMLCKMALKHNKENINKRINEKFLPFLSIKTNGEKYYCQEEAVGNIGFVGLSEAVRIHIGKNIYDGKEDKEGIKFAEKIVDNTLVNLKDEERIKIVGITTEDAGKRLFLADSNRYGPKVIEEKVGKKLISYSCNAIIPYDVYTPLNVRIDVESIFQKKMSGGHCLNIFIKEPSPDPQNMYKHIKKIMQEGKLSSFMFSREFTYCKNCGTMIGGTITKCDICGHSLTNILYYSRDINVYRKRDLQKNVVSYLL
ncbi:MAG: anaerobic ribonucleoside-triphosphate reductase [Nitrososphaeria archaeon]